MLSIVNETETKVFQQNQLTVKIFPTVQQMGKAAAQEVADRICNLLEGKAEINMIFAAAPSQEEFLHHLISDQRINWNRINAFHMDEYIGLLPDAPQSFGCLSRISLKLSIAQSMEIFLKNVRPVYCGEKKNLRYIWTQKVHSYSIYNF